MNGKSPLVYACSGCSSAAQMTNQMALWLDREGVAEMSCIAGVGGGVPGLVRTAQSGRAVIALDGCVLHCARACLANAGVRADVHLTLSDYGVKKRRHADFDREEARAVYVKEVLPPARMLLQETQQAEPSGSRGIPLSGKPQTDCPAS